VSPPPRRPSLLRMPPGVASENNVRQMGLNKVARNDQRLPRFPSVWVPDLDSSPACERCSPYLPQSRFLDHTKGHLDVSTVGPFSEERRVGTSKPRSDEESREESSKPVKPYC